MFSRSELRHADVATRRTFVTHAASTCLGLSAYAGISGVALGGQGNARPTATAKSVIYLFLNGGLSQLDSFDPKPGRDCQGETGVISTAIPGVSFSEYFPKLAVRADKCGIVRSLSTQTGDHIDATYLMRTSNKVIASVKHPSMGPWAEQFLGRSLDSRLPASVNINVADRHPGNGFLPPRLAPLPIADPIKGLENTSVPSYLTDDNLSRRIKLINRMNATFRDRFRYAAVNDYATFYDEAVSLMASGDLDLFKVEKEPQEIREAFGMHKLGQSLLLARRLVKGGVRFIEVGDAGWDMHYDLWVDMPTRAGLLDNSLATLIDTLESDGILDETLIVVATEFGRKPEIDPRGGRGHHPGVFSSLLIGGGIKGGAVIGSSDKNGFSVDRDGVSIADMNATIATALGVPITERVTAPDGRPFTAGAGGSPLQELLG